MTAAQFNRRVTKACACCGPIVVLLFLIGAVPLAEFFAPPTSAQKSAQEIAEMYRDNLTAIRLGCFVMFISAALFLPFGMSITEATRRDNLGGPLLGRIQTASVAVCTFVIILIPLFWGIATYRAGEGVSAEIVQTWNDAGWMGVLFAVPPFSLWCAVIAVAIFRDTSPDPLVPRWAAYLNIWCAILFVPAMMMIFFHHGAFSQNGVMTFWMPVAVFFAWIVSMTGLVIRAVDRQADAEARDLAAAAARSPAPVA